LEKCSKARNHGFHYLFRRDGTILMTENPDQPLQPAAGNADSSPPPMAEEMDQPPQLATLQGCVHETFSVRRPTLTLRNSFMKWQCHM